MKAAKLLKQGLSESEVARRAGVHRQSVNRWSRQMAESGKSGLNKAGRKPRLSRADLKKIESGLKHGPEALGYDTPLWTAWRVAQLIEEECGVRFHPGHVWRILRQLSIIQFCSPLYIPISKREFIGRSKTAPDRLTSDQPTSHGQLVRISGAPIHAVRSCCKVYPSNFRRQASMRPPTEDARHSAAVAADRRGLPVDAHQSHRSPPRREWGPGSAGLLGRMGSHPGAPPPAACRLPTSLVGTQSLIEIAGPVQPEQSLVGLSGSRESGIAFPEFRMARRRVTFAVEIATQHGHGEHRTPEIVGRW